MRPAKESKRGDVDCEVDSCNRLTESESSSNLIRHTTNRSAASSRPFGPVDLFKALELIKFVGCETRHQLIAALRMLVPLIENDQTTTQIERHRGYSMPHLSSNIGTRSQLSVSSYQLQVDRVLNSVVEMYTERKLTSRAKKAKDSERGRLEVGQKLKVVEDEVCQYRTSEDTHIKNTERGICSFLTNPSSFAHSTLSAFDTICLLARLPSPSMRRPQNISAPSADIIYVYEEEFHREPAIRDSEITFLTTQT